VRALGIQSFETAAVLSFTNRSSRKANMRRAFIISLTGATLAVSLAATAPASAAPPPDSLCAQWLYGEVLVRDTWGWHYERTPLRCLRWVRVDRHQVGFNPFPNLGGPSPWMTYGEWQALNPQPLPPKAGKRRF
jgi:hypothetical protein